MQSKHKGSRLGSQKRIWFGTYLQPSMRKLLEELTVAEMAKNQCYRVPRYYVIEQGLLLFARRYHPNLIPKGL